MLNNKWFACATLALAAVATGCSSTGDKNANAPAEAVRPTTTSQGNVAAAPAATNTGGTPAATQSIVYFDFDSSELKAESQVVVAAWAKYLTANPTAKAQLQGNTDERGTREYNLALGERRSATVSSALQSAGVAASQVELTSNGEEKPVALGHDEASWSQNRRVEIVGQ
ncbi:peptidoglycan-associated lipoprotein Pal [Nevskia sp.]|uniref:peptidoglycan-associated lipoprotein Pal n=1 Tax=Nevskia sp. TaxID=1929292 RepID=UPI0025D396AB|nr:peptidoglycan-associated lipoprotein Pal [Nevskia sp.]